MNIIGTINPWGCNKFIDVIKHVINIGITCFRVNLKTYYEKEHFDYLIEVIKKMILVDNTISFIFDIGFPRDTARTVINNNNGFIEINEKDLFISNGVPSYSQNTIYINKSVNLQCGDIIYYGDGQYNFTISECCSPGLWKAIPNIRDIVIWGNTALHFPREIYEEPQNMELISAFFSDIKSLINYKIALSFVEGKEDILKFIESYGETNIICKIESFKGIENIDEILELCDCIMLGRGDLLFNSEFNKFLYSQEVVVKKCIENNKQIIVSTGILTSMKNNLLPARTELIDILLLKQLGVTNINLSSHLLQSSNIDRVVELIDSLK